MNYVLDFLKFAIEVFLAVGGGFALSSYLKKNAATQKNEHIKSALVFASQAVLTVQAFSVTGAEQQQAAAALLKKWLDDTKIGNRFTEEQILAYIQSAYVQAKTDGTLAEVKRVEDKFEVEK